MKIKSVVVHPDEEKKVRSSEGVNWWSRQAGCWGQAGVAGKRVGFSAGRGRGNPYPFLLIRVDRSLPIQLDGLLIRR